jgi:hypothetical protein
MRSRNAKNTSARKHPIATPTICVRARNASPANNPLSPAANNPRVRSNRSSARNAANAIANASPSVYGCVVAP